MPIDDNELPSNPELEFQRYRRLDGSVERLSVGRRNGRLMAILPPSCAEPPDREQPIEIYEQSRLYVNLNPLEAATWKKILTGQSINSIAAEEGVRRSAIYARILGNSQNQGGMVSKNFWVLLWWVLRQRMNSHDDLPNFKTQSVRPPADDPKTRNPLSL